MGSVLHRWPASVVQVQSAQLVLSAECGVLQSGTGNLSDGKGRSTAVHLSRVYDRLHQQGESMIACLTTLLPLGPLSATLMVASHCTVFSYSAVNPVTTVPQQHTALHPVAYSGRMGLGGSFDFRCRFFSCCSLRQFWYFEQTRGMVCVMVWCVMVWCV